MIDLIKNQVMDDYWNLKLNQYLDLNYSVMEATKNATEDLCLIWYSPETLDISYFRYYY